MALKKLSSRKNSNYSYTVSRLGSHLDLPPAFPTGGAPAAGFLPKNMSRNKPEKTIRIRIHWRSDYSASLVFKWLNLVHLLNSFYLNGHVIGCTI